MPFYICDGIDKFGVHMKRETQCSLDLPPGKMSLWMILRVQRRVQVASTSGFICYA